MPQIMSLGSDRNKQCSLRLLQLFFRHSRAGGNDGVAGSRLRDRLAIADAVRPLHDVLHEDRSCPPAIGLVDLRQHSEPRPGVGAVITRRPAMIHEFQSSRPLMGSRCDLKLCGPDSALLQDLANLLIEELERVEQLLSRFDATSELSRINRTAPRAWCQVDRELAAILADCSHWWRRTCGAFDPAVQPATATRRSTFADVELDLDRHRIRFAVPETRLDLGGYGKGYALDCAAQQLVRYPMTGACLSLGSSSILTLGEPPGVPGWTIDWRGDGLHRMTPQTILVSNASISTSATGSAGASDILIPATGRPLVPARCCSVVANLGTAAEVISTALLVMDPPEAVRWIAEFNEPGLIGVWLEDTGSLVLATGPFRPRDAVNGTR